MKHLLILCLVLFLQACGYLMSDDKLTLTKTPYTGNELRTDGYYYMQDEQGTVLFFLYRNGIKLQCYHHSTTDFSEIESRLVGEDYLRSLKKEKTRWQLFVVQESSFIFEGWGTSVGGGRPAFRCISIIENDTTIRITRTIQNGGDQIFDKNDVYHFRPFSPKPDSINAFL